ncbi:peptide synthetase [Escherichia coli]|nr:peptide synthetase [Escherichia coli]
MQFFERSGYLTGGHPFGIQRVTNGAIVIHTQRLKSDPGGNLLS